MSLTLEKIIEALELHPDGSSRRIILGKDIMNREMVQHLVPAGVWQGSRVIGGGEFALLGMTMAPGYTPEDYVGGERKSLMKLYPDEMDIIEELSRPAEA